MKCSEIDEAFALFDLKADKYKGSGGKLKPIPDPVPGDKLSNAIAITRKQKLRRLAAIMQAKQLNAARTQLTADDMAIAFQMAHQ